MMICPKNLLLQLILTDRAGRQRGEPCIDLVISGPEAPGITDRDTSVVVRELFRHADRSVLVIGYGKRGRSETSKWDLISRAGGWPNGSSLISSFSMTMVWPCGPFDDVPTCGFLSARSGC